MSTMFKFSETYAAHRCAALEAERDDWKRKAEELTPEDMRGMAHDTNALLKAKIEALEAENARLEQRISDERVARDRELEG